MRSVRRPLADTALAIVELTGAARAIAGPP